MRRVFSLPSSLIGTVAFVVALLLVFFMGKLAITLSHKANLDSVIRDLNQHHQIITLFQQKYQALPGDMSRATVLWPDYPTSNGNGNHQVSAMNKREDLLVWQHLHYAGLTRHAYDGQQQNPQLFSHFPGSKIAGSGFGFYNPCPHGSCVHGRSGNFLVFGSLWGKNIQGAALNPQDSHYIDQKIDDGNAHLGTLLSTNAIGGTSDCTTKTTHHFNLQNKQPACRLWFSFR